MSDQPTLDFTTAGDAGDALDLAGYAQRAYLEYALSVVKGRALPDVCDGLKPVQRRILYAMDRMGLGYSGPTRSTAAKPVKSARLFVHHKINIRRKIFFDSVYGNFICCQVQPESAFKNP